MLTEKDWKRFWKKVDKSPGYGPKGTCWRWIGTKFNTGYGAFGVGGAVGNNRGAHRIVVNLWDSKLCACHTCDTRDCINPAHIFIGTKGDNNRDTVRKGRWYGGTNKWKSGEQHHMCKHSKETVLELRALRAQGWTYPQLGEKLGVAPGTVWNIIHRKGL